jgi:hypothetical protein
MISGGGDRNLVEVPFVARSRKTPAYLVGKALAELQRPLLDRLMADQDTVLLQL